MSKTHDSGSVINRSPSNASIEDGGKKGEDIVGSASGAHDAVYGIGGVGRTARRLKARHVTFIGFGGGIGTGLFVGTGAALANAGPLGLLLAFIIVGMILWCVMESIGELATLVSSPTFLKFEYEV